MLFNLKTFKGVTKWQSFQLFSAAYMNVYSIPKEIINGPPLQCRENLCWIHITMDGHKPNYEPQFIPKWASSCGCEMWFMRTCGLWTAHKPPCFLSQLVQFIRAVHGPGMLVLKAMVWNSLKLCHHGGKTQQWASNSPHSENPHSGSTGK